MLHLLFGVIAEQGLTASQTSTSTGLNNLALPPLPIDSESPQDRERIAQTFSGTPRQVSQQGAPPLLKMKNLADVNDGSKPKFMPQEPLQRTLASPTSHLPTDHRRVVASPDDDDYVSL